MTSQQLQDATNIVTIIFAVLGFLVAICAWLIPRDRLGKFWNRRRNQILKGAGIVAVVSVVILLWRIGWLSWLQATVTLPVWGLVLAVVLLLVFAGSVYLALKKYVQPARKKVSELSEKGKIADVFQEDFQDLDNWQFQGEWSVEGETGVLRVTNSGHGGIAKRCLTWTNYVFEFDTKIENKYSGWIIRAKNLANLVMLQCRQSEIQLCFRANGKYDTLDWTRENVIRLPQNLKLNSWYHVRIEVKETQASVVIEGGDIVEGKMKMSLPPLKHPKEAVNYLAGSIGFREADDECALFRDVRVKRLP